MKKQRTVKPPSRDTAKVIEAMVELMKQRPDSTWHPSLFSNMRGLRANVAPAVRYLKQYGLIVIAYRNIDNQPVYKASATFLDALERKNPRKKTWRKVPGGILYRAGRGVKLHAHREGKPTDRIWLYWVTPAGRLDIQAWGDRGSDSITQIERKASRMLGHPVSAMTVPPRATQKMIRAKARREVSKFRTNPGSAFDYDDEPEYLGDFQEGKEPKKANSGDAMVVYRPRYKTYEVWMWEFDDSKRRDGWIFIGSSPDKKYAIAAARDAVK